METLKNQSVKEALKKCNPQRAIIALAEITDQFDTGIQNAQATADQALQDAAAAATVANEAKQEAAQATINVGEAFDNTRVTPNSSTVVVEFDRINGGAQNTALPVANTTNAGILNAKDYRFFQEYDARIRAVEGVSKIYLVELPSDNPSSQQITLAYTSQWPDAPNPPLEGTVVVDPARNNLSYRWNTQSNTWYKISEVAIQQFTNTTLGTIKGSTSDGEVQANADGTGSVTGWDIVKGNITTLQENAISNARAVPSPTGVDLELINQNNVVKNTASLPIASSLQAGLITPAIIQQINNAEYPFAARYNFSAKIARGENRTLTIAVGDKTINLRLIPAGSLQMQILLSGTNGIAIGTTVIRNPPNTFSNIIYGNNVTTNINFLQDGIFTSEISFNNQVARLWISSKYSQDNAVYQFDAYCSHELADTTTPARNGGGPSA